MDPLSQGVLGAVAAQSAARREQMKTATVAGLLGGMAPDLDVLIRSSSDPLLALEFHRHFTHSLAFIPVGGAVVGTALWLLARRRVSLPWLIGFSTLGWATHGLLDACTTYGTQLLWPFSNLRIAWNNVGIVDPVPTLAWLIGTVAALRAGKAFWARLGLAIGVLYLLLGVVQRERAGAVQADLIRARGHHAVRAEVKPTVLNLFLWRSIYEHDGRFQVDAIRVGALDGPRIYEGDSVVKLTPDAFARAIPEGSVLAADIERFTWFSDGWVALHPDHAGVIGDVRYALLPHEIHPLWGIVVNPGAPDAHTPFENYREPTGEAWDTFLAMMWGRDLPDAPDQSTGHQ